SAVTNQVYAEAPAERLELAHEVGAFDPVPSNNLPSAESVDADSETAGGEQELRTDTNDSVLTEVPILEGGVEDAAPVTTEDTNEISELEVAAPAALEVVGEAAGAAEDRSAGDNALLKGQGDLLGGD
ncbi:MAG: hypothetical protein PHO57_10960, partial [Acidithiobacillus sp.]|nr:hypothetical protein [Acidithiobacillus sp.]